MPALRRLVKINLPGVADLKFSHRIVCDLMASAGRAKKLTEPADTGNSPSTKSGKSVSPRKKSHPLVRLILILVLVLVIIGGVVYWFLHRFEVETGDAFTRGRAITIVPHVSGYVTELLVDDNQFIKAGQLLARIDPRDWQANRDKAAAAENQAEASVAANQMMLQVAEKNFPGRLLAAQGQLAAAKAQEFRAEADYKRQHSVMRAATSQQDIDYSRASLDAARAQVTEAQAQVEIAAPVVPNVSNAKAMVSGQKAQLASTKAALALADLNLQWTEIRTPHDGWISQSNVEAGHYVSTGQSLFSIVEPEVWVIANYKETQITSMRPGPLVDIEVYAYPAHELHGHISDTDCWPADDCHLRTDGHCDRFYSHGAGIILVGAPGALSRLLCFSA